MKNFLKLLTNKNNLYLIAVLLFAFLIRVLFLNNFPIGMTHDELNHIFAAKSLFWTHSFAPGTAPAVISTNMSNFTMTIPEIPAVILSVLIGPLPFSMFTGRIVGAILSVLAILAVYFLALHITKKRLFANVCVLLMAINPWSILLGRTMAELNFFIVFFLWGFLVLIKSKGLAIFRALPLYLLGFFSYTGGQVSFYIFVIITLIYHYFATGKERKYLKIYLIFAGFISLVFAGYIFVATHNQSYKARSGELYLPNSPGITEQVNQMRKLAVQIPFNNLFINKATVYARGFITKYINTFSVNNLFLEGESRAIFSYQTHGTMYLIDFLFIVIGLSSLFVLNKRGWVLFMAVIIGCSVTSGMSVVEGSYSQRVGLIYPFLVMLSGIGVVTAVSFAKSKRVRIAASCIIGIFYFISLVNLLHIYFVRFPIYASEGWFFQDRLLASYISKSEAMFPNTKIFIYTSEPKIIFEEYLFYTNSYGKTNAAMLNKRLDVMDYSINNLNFSGNCPDENIDKSAILIFDATFICKKFLNPPNLVRITRLKDVNENYLIYNDKLCNGLSLNRSIPQSAYRNFSVERESQNEFCMNWITKIEK